MCAGRAWPTTTPPAVKVLRRDLGELTPKTVIELFRIETENQFATQSLPIAAAVAIAGGRQRRIYYNFYYSARVVLSGTAMAGGRRPQ